MKYLSRVLFVLGVTVCFLAPLDQASGQTRDRSRRQGRSPRTRTNDKAPKVGDKAPDFKLKSLDGKSETQLSKFRGKKPVILFFGSYT